MRILSLTQPYATLIAIRAKTFETRSWRASYRGPIAIHATKSFAPVGGQRAFKDLVATEPFHTAIRNAEYANADALPTGAIVAVCTLIEVYAIDENGLRAHATLHPLPDEPERSFGDYTPGRFAWKLIDIQPLLQPLSYKGAMGLRPISDPATLKAIYAQVR